MREILRRHIISVAFISLLLGYFVFVSESGPELYGFSGNTMGTTYNLQYVDEPSRPLGETLQSDVVVLLARLDKEIFSTYAVDSELSRLNQAPMHEAIKVSPELLGVLLLAKEVSDLTRGAFDVTVGPLVNLWGFGPDFHVDRIPQQSEIDELMAQVGYTNLVINVETSTVTKLADVSIDLSAIAKGYVVDQVADFFEERGVNSYFLEIGGEIRLRGVKPDAKSWIPALESPVEAGRQIFAVLDSRGGAFSLAGSGDYRNYFLVDGNRYSHEIDPTTGWPVTHNLAAAYVIDSSAARADALATALMVMGERDSIALANSIELPVYLIAREINGELSALFTASFSKYLTESPEL